VLVSAGNYATLSLIDIAYRGVQPLFFATPVALGGLGLTPPIIGNILSCYGILNGIAQVFFFARIHDRLGSKNTFLYGILCCFPLIAAFPVMNFIAKSSGDTDGLAWSIWALVGLQIFLSIGMNFSYGLQSSLLFHLRTLSLFQVPSSSSLPVLPPIVPQWEQ
jgi:hypothetical protein